MMTKHYNIQVFGRVQGVGFRFETRRQAHLYGIKGLVKNQGDGSVYIEAEGKEDILNEFVRWCHNGPSHSRVERVDIEEAPLKSFSGFEVTF